MRAVLGRRQVSERIRMAAFKDDSSFETWAEHLHARQTPPPAHRTDMCQPELVQPRRAAKCPARYFSINNRLDTSSLIVRQAKGQSTACIPRTRWRPDGRMPRERANARCASISRDINRVWLIAGPCAASFEPGAGPIYAKAAVKQENKSFENSCLGRSRE